MEFLFYFIYVLADFHFHICAVLFEHMCLCIVYQKKCVYVFVVVVLFERGFVFFLNQRGFVFMYHNRCLYLCESAG